MNQNNINWAASTEDSTCMHDNRNMKSNLLVVAFTIELVKELSSHSRSFSLFFVKRSFSVWWSGKKVKELSGSFRWYGIYRLNKKFWYECDFSIDKKREKSTHWLMWKSINAHTKTTKIQKFDGWLISINANSNGKIKKWTNRLPCRYLMLFFSYYSQD